MNRDKIAVMLHTVTLQDFLDFLSFISAKRKLTLDIFLMHAPLTPVRQNFNNPADVNRLDFRLFLLVGGFPLCADFYNLFIVLKSKRTLVSIAYVF